MAEYKNGKYIDPVINNAWTLYCAEAAVTFDQRDSWEQLPEYLQKIYLEKVTFKIKAEK